MSPHLVKKLSTGDGNGLFQDNVLLCGDDLAQLRFGLILPEANAYPRNHCGQHHPQEAETFVAVFVAIFAKKSPNSIPSRSAIARNAWMSFTFIHVRRRALSGSRWFGTQEMVSPHRFFCKFFLRLFSSFHRKLKLAGICFLPV